MRPVIDRRKWWGFLMLVVAATLVAPPRTLQAGQSEDEKQKRYEPVSRTLPTKDGKTIKITYYQSNRAKDAPVVVLLHNKDGNRFIWGGKDSGGFADRLQNEGCAVVTVDLRGHGESLGGAAGDKKSNREPRRGDYVAMVDFDLEAVRKFIFEEHQAGNLNMNKTAIVGPEVGATIAVFYAVNNWRKPRFDDAPVGSGRQTPRGEDVRALVLISPQQNVQGLALAQPLKFLSSPQLDVAFMVAVAKDDSQDKGQAKKAFDQISGVPDSDKRMYYNEYPGSARGTELLGKRTKLEDHISVFLGKHLREPEIPWTDRRPANERN
ncbi:MAG: alpha/beta fold hydrolase [Planctomycetaceae bacterium]|nr:MAG: alpha/beta fold hydrolase [Planctomycetaceae bacterium]